jgi:hypothetical protein
MPGFAEVLVDFTPTSQGGRSLSVRLGEDATPHHMPDFVVRGGEGTYLGVVGAARHQARLRHHVGVDRRRFEVLVPEPFLDRVYFVTVFQYNSVTELQAWRMTPRDT